MGLKEVKRAGTLGSASAPPVLVFAAHRICLVNRALVQISGGGCVPGSPTVWVELKQRDLSSNSFWEYSWQAYATARST